jgi:hypothetical protein
VTPRPLYGELAWACDLVVPTPADPPPERVVALLAEGGVPPCAAVVDAGCGAGRCAAGGRRASSSAPTCSPGGPAAGRNVELTAAGRLLAAYAADALAADEAIRAELAACG